MTRDEAIDRAASRMSYAITKARLYGDKNGEFNADMILAEARAAFHECLAASGFEVVPEEVTSALRFYANPEVYKPDATGRVYDMTRVATNALTILDAEREPLK